MLMLSSTMLENVDLHPTGCSNCMQWANILPVNLVPGPMQFRAIGIMPALQLCAFSLKPRKDSISRRRACNSVPGFLAWRKKNCLKSSTAGQSMKRIEKVWRSSSREVKVEGAFFLLSDL